VGDLVDFTRDDGHQTLFCAFNLSDKPATFTRPDGHWATTGIELGGHNLTDHKIQTLQPRQSCLALKTDTNGS
jgi:alpha-glucosidase